MGADESEEQPELPREIIEFELLYPLFGAPYENVDDVPVWKLDRHIDRWLAQGQAEAEEREYQREKQEEERAK